MPMTMSSSSSSKEQQQQQQPGEACEGVALKKGPWTAAEDAILVAYVSKHGEGNWNNVQKHSGLFRCGKSCRLRWANHLRPNLKKGAFTPEEERLIIELHAKLGNKWARMAAQLPGRTDNEIKNYWNTRIKRRLRAGLPVYPSDVQNFGHATGTTGADSGYVYDSELLDYDAVSSPSSGISSKLRTHINLASLHGCNNNLLADYDFDTGMRDTASTSPIILRRASSKRLRDNAAFHFQQQQHFNKRSISPCGSLEFSGESLMHCNSNNAQCLDSSSDDAGGSMLLEALLQEARMVESGTDGEQQLLMLNNSHAVEDVVTMMGAAAAAAAATGTKCRKMLRQQQQQHECEEAALWNHQEQLCSVFSDESMNGSHKNNNGSSNNWEESSKVPAIDLDGSMDEDIATAAAAASAYTDEEISTLLDFARADTAPLNLEWENPPPENKFNDDNQHYLTPAESVADAFDLFGASAATSAEMVDLDQQLGSIFGAHNAPGACIWDVGYTTSPTPWTSMPGATQLHDECKPLLVSSVVEYPCPIY